MRESRFHDTRHFVQQYQFRSIHTSRKQNPPMLVTVRDDTVFTSTINVLVFLSIIELQLSRSHSDCFPLSTVIFSKPLQWCESTIPNDLHAVGQCQFGQTACNLRMRNLDNPHPVGQYQFGQTTATTESKSLDALQGVRQCQFGQAATTIESKSLDALQGVRQYPSSVKPLQP